MSKAIGLLLVTVIVVGFLIPQLFLSKSYAMDRGTVIAVPQAAVHAVVSDLTTWKDWTAWNKEADPTIAYTYVGDPGTVGHAMEWSGEKLGKGKLVLTGIAPDRIEYDMEFDGQDKSAGSIVLAAAGEGSSSTSVTWGFSGEMEGMPYKRYFGLMMDKMVGPDFEAGLTSLKERLESPK
jgi:hypothetical protein